MRIKYHTLGCKVNSHETDQLKREMASLGFIEVPPDEQAEVVVINTCSVTHQSDVKSRKLIRQGLKEGSKVVAMGCSLPKEAIKDCLFIPNAKKDEAAELIKRFAGVQHSEGLFLEDQEKTRSFIKVQDGCNNFCSYCIIPYLRGREKSVPEEEILQEVAFYATRGHKEIVLSGIHLSSYGHDTNTSLIELMRNIEQIEGVARIRLGSLEQSLISPSFLEECLALKSFCDHFHLSLQSGSASVLQRMNRRYSPQQFAEKVALIRAYFPDAAITTDIIVGFSGESEQEFEETMQFAEEMAFSRIHVFPYSKRKGTKAALLSDLPATVKRERAARLRELALKLETNFLDRFIGRRMEVLMEKHYGHTRNYLQIYTTLPMEEGSIVQLEVLSRKETALIGK